MLMASHYFNMPLIDPVIYCQQYLDNLQASNPLLGLNLIGLFAILALSSFYLVFFNKYLKQKYKDDNKALEYIYTFESIAVSLLFGLSTAVLFFLVLT